MDQFACVSASLTLSSTLLFVASLERARHRES